MEDSHRAGRDLPQIRPGVAWQGGRRRRDGFVEHRSDYEHVSDPV